MVWGIQSKMWIENDQEKLRQVNLSAIDGHDSLQAHRFVPSTTSNTMVTRNTNATSPIRRNTSPLFSSLSLVLISPRSWQIFGQLFLFITVGSKGFCYIIHPRLVAVKTSGPPSTILLTSSPTYGSKYYPIKAGKYHQACFGIRRRSSTCRDFDRYFLVFSTLPSPGRSLVSHAIRQPKSSANFTLSCLLLVETNSITDTSSMDVSRHGSFPGRYPGSTRTIQPSHVLLHLSGWLPSHQFMDNH